MSTALKVYALGKKKSGEELESFYEALNRVQAIIEFNLDGTVIDANENFLKTLGYELNEIVGQHHKIFCEEAYSKSIEYQQFWEKLRKGEFVTGEFRRVGKGGKDVWIIASYNPVFDQNGELIKVVNLVPDSYKEFTNGLEALYI